MESEQPQPLKEPESGVVRPEKPEKSGRFKVSNEKRQKITLGILVALTIVSFSFLGGWVGARFYFDSPNEAQQTENARRVINEESELISSIAEDVGPSVVSVNVLSNTRQTNPLTGEILAQESAGTGFIVSSDGYVMTNRHVIPSGATEVTVTMADGTELDDVTVVGRTEDGDSLDVAFLKINDAKGTTLRPVELGDSDQMKVGDMVVAIGNALGQFQNTVTSGIISGYGRSVVASGGEAGDENLQNLFQTDAAINQGNSGGPLVNAEGHVIAINTAVATGEAENVGFAIPINDARGLIQGITRKGEFLRPYIGVRYVQLTPEAAEEFNIEQTEGAYIATGDNGEPAILPNSPAAEAGLKAKDIIIEINGTKVTSNKPLTSVVGRFAVGETVTITYIRGGQQQTLQLTLEASPGS